MSPGYLFKTQLFLILCHDRFSWSKRKCRDNGERHQYPDVPNAACALLSRKIRVLHVYLVCVNASGRNILCYQAPHNSTEVDGRLMRSLMYVCARFLYQPKCKWRAIYQAACWLREYMDMLCHSEMWIQPRRLGLCILKEMCTERSEWESLSLSLEQKLCIGKVFFKLLGFVNALLLF